MAILMRVGVQEGKNSPSDHTGVEEGGNYPPDQIREQERVGGLLTRLGSRRGKNGPTYQTGGGGGHKKGIDGPTDQMEWQNGSTYKNSKENRT